VRLKAILDHEDARLPFRTDRTGKTIGGGSNPVYRGRLTHKGQAHDGLHDPIVDRETWDEVQRLLAEHATRATRSRVKTQTRFSPASCSMTAATG
jgi:site-specific DNA recombinase